MFLGKDQLLEATDRLVLRNIGLVTETGGRVAASCSTRPQAWSGGRSIVRLSLKMAHTRLRWFPELEWTRSLRDVYREKTIMGHCERPRRSLKPQAFEIWLAWWGMFQAKVRNGKCVNSSTYCSFGTTEPTQDRNCAKGRHRTAEKNTYLFHMKDKIPGCDSGV